MRFDFNHSNDILAPLDRPKRIRILLRLTAIEREDGWFSVAVSKQYLSLGRDARSEWFGQILFDEIRREL